MQSKKLQIEYLPTDQLQMYDGNANIHSAHQIDQIAESIEEFDFSSPILAWHNPRGHLRLNSYHVMKKPKYDGKINQSKTRRSDCKTATFMGSLEDG